MRYYVAQIRTGDLIGELPSLQIDGSLERRLGTYKTGGLKLPVLDEWTPDDWQQLIRPWQVVIVVCDDADAILWSGIPESLAIGPDSVVDINCVTIEKYLDKVYVGSRTFRNKDQTSDICQDLVFFGTSQDSGLGISLTIDTPPSKRYRDREYYSDEDARLLTRVQQLAEVSDGFDWTIETRWGDGGHSFFEFVFRTGYPYLGTITDQPEAVFEMYTGVQTSVTDFTYNSMFGDGYFATQVKVSGDGQGEDKPYSKFYGPTTTPATPYPRIEYREAAQGVTEAATLNAKAAGLAEDMQNGREQIEITARIDAFPTPADVHLGDSVRVEIRTDALDFTKVYRLIGYSIDFEGETWKPVLYDNSQILDEAAGEEDDDG